MLVLITYDVNTEDASGRGRLRKVAKECVNYGQRVQNFSSLNSGGWNRVGTRSVEIRLNAGQNTIRIVNATNWMPDMDYMRLELLEADGIGELRSSSKSKVQSSELYDLSGRPIIATRKGLKIKKGRIFITK